MKTTRTAVSILLTVIALTAAAIGFAATAPSAEAPVQLAQSTSAILEAA